MVPATKEAGNLHGSNVPPDAPSTIALQPRPRKTRRTILKSNDGYVTTITRFWKNGDEARCQLCSICTADTEEGCCSVTVAQFVAPDSCPLFATVRMRQQDGVGNRELRRPRFVAE